MPQCRTIKQVGDVQFNCVRFLGHAGDCEFALDATPVERYLKAMRFDKAHHLGLGDIRLTIGQQEELIAMIKELV